MGPKHTPIYIRYSFRTVFGFLGLADGNLFRWILQACRITVYLLILCSHCGGVYRCSNDLHPPNAPPKEIKFTPVVVLVRCLQRLYQYKSSLQITYCTTTGVDVSSINTSLNVTVAGTQSAAYQRVRVMVALHNIYITNTTIWIVHAANYIGSRLLIAADMKVFQ